MRCRSSTGIVNHVCLTTSGSLYSLLICVLGCRITEEPCVMKVTCTDLKTSAFREELAEFTNPPL
jgi:hypothetical protein